jgi:hypothetical protein
MLIYGVGLLHIRRIAKTIMGNTGMCPVSGETMPGCIVGCSFIVLFG